MDVEINSYKEEEMAVDVDITTGENNSNSNQQIKDIIAYLVHNNKVIFKSQQRGEDEPNTNEKTRIAFEIFNKNITNFLLRFGRFLTVDQLNYFKQFEQDDEEMKMILLDLYRFHSSINNQKQIKNRRYEKLRLLIAENSYFSEVEMMKRNPLLYEQLIGQYLSQEEKKERDKVKNENYTFVNILMEGIERDVAELKRKSQKEEEDNALEEENSNSDSSRKNSLSKSSSAMQSNESSLDGFESRTNWGEMRIDPTNHWGEYSQTKDMVENSGTKLYELRSVKNPGPKWGEFINKTSKKSACIQPSKLITAEERLLLRNEFTTLMYQSFLDGDDDFDYDSVDHNDTYDNLDIVNNDEEEKYFDSEEPEDVEVDTMKTEESSEDELDIYMSALNNHPAVSKLSKDMQNL